MPTHLPNRQARPDVPAGAFHGRKASTATATPRVAAGYQATAYSTAGILSDDDHRGRALAVVAGGSSVAIVAGLPFGILVGQTWGWRSAMWVLVALAVLAILAVRLLPAAHAPRLSLRERARALTDRRVLAILVGTVRVLARLHRHRVLARDHAQLLAASHLRLVGAAHPPSPRRRSACSPRSSPRLFAPSIEPRICAAASAAAFAT